MRYTRLSTYDITKGTFGELSGIVEKRPPADLRQGAWLR